MTDEYVEEGLTRALAASRVCQDIVLKALAEGPLNRNVTIKGGVVMRSLTKNNRRATSDIDLDFIHYSLDEPVLTTEISSPRDHPFCSTNYKNNRYTITTKAPMIRKRVTVCVSDQPLFLRT